ncbi:uncharacterized protein CLUP02_03025 [Colletotrichum lupini]|uniref:Uncharacterized protein n=1 Tax=Colletotrichum lupini TaxID=145971 RepID=A0A9Q8WBY3_9PEZI|nr:uncharacterized protein CLUP02_03025 [Colletotrichum lupini]UQC77556.1 hypothetical protein CLUP02_03025 [Colletotrichum lupini]
MFLIGFEPQPNGGVHTWPSHGQIDVSQQHITQLSPIKDYFTVTQCTFLAAQAGKLGQHAQLTEPFEMGTFGIERQECTIGENRIEFNKLSKCQHCCKSRLKSGGLTQAGQPVIPFHLDERRQQPLEGTIYPTRNDRDLDPNGCAHPRTLLDRTYKYLGGARELLQLQRLARPEQFITDKAGT